MKNRIVIILFLVLSIGVAHAQNAGKTTDNYINEAIVIARIKTLMSQYGYTADGVSSVDKTTIEKAKETIVNNIINDIVQQKKRFNTGGNQNTTNTNTAPGGGNQPGAINATVNNRVGQNVNTVKHSAFAQKLRKEVNDLMVLMELDKSSHIKDISQEDFTKGFQSLGYIENELSRQGSVNQLQGGESIVSTAGLAGLESEIIYGITDFAISRAKEEILEAHLNYLYKEMSSDPILKKMIPHSLEQMRAFIKDNSISLAKYGGLWKAAFQEDLRALPVTMQDETLVKEILSKVDVDVKASKQIVPIITGGNKLIYGLYLRKNLVQILADMSYDYNQDSSDNLAVFKRVVLMSDIIADALGHMTSKGYVMANLASVENLDKDVWDIFFKLLYARHKKELGKAVGVKNAEELVDLSDGSKRNQLIHTVKNSLDLLNTYKKVIPETKQKVDVEDISRLYDLQLQVVDNGIEYLKLFQLDSKDRYIGEAITDYETIVKPILDDLSEIGEGLAAYKYGKVLDGTLNIINEAHKIACNKTSGQQCDNDDYEKLVKYLTKYGSFMVNVLDAKDSDDVKEALDEIVPRGLYKMKFANRWSITASLYPGAFAGTEQLTKYSVQNNTLNKSATTQSSASSVSFYLPIGIDINHGIGKKNNWCAGVYLQVFDLGAVMNYRLNADSTESTNPQISFQQLLSPGASFMIHLPKSPVVFGVGANYTPSLRRIQDSGLTYDANAFRFGGFLAVDVTVLPLYLSKITRKKQ